MHDEIFTSTLALRATTTHVLSARPDAPVVEDPGPRVPMRRSRQVAAAALRGVAGWVEPHRACGVAIPSR